MGPPAERLYAVEPVGVEMMSPSARNDETNHPATDTFMMMMRASALLCDHGVVEHAMRSAVAIGSGDAHVERDARFDVEVSLEHPFEDRGKFFDPHLGEKSERPHVHAEDRDVPRCVTGD